MKTDRYLAQQRSESSPKQRRARRLLLKGKVVAEQDLCSGVHSLLNLPRLAVRPLKILFSRALVRISSNSNQQPARALSVNLLSSNPQAVSSGSHRSSSKMHRPTASLGNPLSSSSNPLAVSSGSHHSSRLHRLTACSGNPLSSSSSNPQTVCSANLNRSRKLLPQTACSVNLSSSKLHPPIVSSVNPLPQAVSLVNLSSSNPLPQTAFLVNLSSSNPPPRTASLVSLSSSNHNQVLSVVHPSSTQVPHSLVVLPAEVSAVVPSLADRRKLRNSNSSCAFIMFDPL